MTREQAIERLLLTVSKNTGATAILVDSLVALDLLKLDPPPEQSARQLIVTAYEKMRPYPIVADALASEILCALSGAGYLTPPKAG